MSRLRIHCFSISLDGYGAGPCQNFENPFGAGGLPLHEWMHRARTFQQIIGEDGGATGIDLPALGYECTEHVPTAGATHVVVKKSR